MRSGGWKAGLYYNDDSALLSRGALGEIEERNLLCTISSFLLCYYCLDYVERFK